MNGTPMHGTVAALTDAITVAHQLLPQMAPVMQLQVQDVIECLQYTRDAARTWPNTTLYDEPHCLARTLDTIQLALQVAPLLDGTPLEHKRHREALAVALVVVKHRIQIMQGAGRMEGEPGPDERAMNDGYTQARKYGNLGVPREGHTQEAYSLGSEAGFCMARVLDGR